MNPKINDGFLTRYDRWLAKPGNRAKNRAYQRAYKARLMREIRRQRAEINGVRKCVDCGGDINPERRAGIIRCDACIEKAKAERSERSRAWWTKRATKQGVAVAANGEAVAVAETAQEVKATVYDECGCRLCKGEWIGNNERGYYCDACRKNRRAEVLDDIDKRNAMKRRIA